MRITVSLLINLVSNGMSIEDVTADYPDLESEDVRQALRYVAWLAEERVEPLDTTEGQMRTRLLPIGEE